MFLFFECTGGHRDLHVLTHSAPTRRSSDLTRSAAATNGSPTRAASTTARCGTRSSHAVVGAVVVVPRASPCPQSRLPSSPPPSCRTCGQTPATPLSRRTQMTAVWPPLTPRRPHSPPTYRPPRWTCPARSWCGQIASCHGTVPERKGAGEGKREEE